MISIRTRLRELDARRGASFLSILAFASLAFMAPLACGAVDDSPTTTPDAGTDADSDANMPPDARICGPRCSRDRKEVLDGCNGDAVLEECSADKGCSASGRCVDACEAVASARGSVGCSFSTLPADAKTVGAVSCFVAVLVNTWDQPVTISAEWGGESLDISNSVYIEMHKDDGNAEYWPLTEPLAPGQAAHVFLAGTKSSETVDFATCPRGVTPALDIDPLVHGTGKEKSFHLRTDKPVAAYSIFPFERRAYSMAATLLLPETTSSKSYIGVVPSKIGAADGTADTMLRTMQIIAQEDDTEVLMRPAFDIAAGRDISAAAIGVPTRWTLDRGEALQITQQGAVSGSRIETNKPIGLFSGAPCARFPSDVDACDAVQHQNTPIEQWGSEYALVPFRPRTSTPPRESVPWTLVGAVDGTVLTWSPAKPQGAPDALSAGQVVNFMTDAISTVKSQDKDHPFHAAVYMTGAAFGGGSQSSLGDPDYVHAIASDQYLERNVFFVDGSLPETSLTVVRKKTQGGFKPVTLECGGELTGFQPIGDGGDYEYAWVVLTKDGAAQAFPKGSCGSGRHVAESDGPFAITVWGVGMYASYGYAAGTGGRPPVWRPMTVP